MIGYPSGQGGAILIARGYLLYPARKIWLAPRAGKMNQIARCDWLPERARWSHLPRSGLPAVSRKINFPESHIINPLLTSSHANLLEQKKWLHNKLSQDWFGKPTWPPLHCFGYDCHDLTCMRSVAKWVKIYKIVRVGFSGCTRDLIQIYFIYSQTCIKFFYLLQLIDLF